ncbi:MAG: cupin domain-containing protein [Actinomycetota bacterium]
MAHVAILDLSGVVTVQPGAVVSRVVHRDDEIDVTVFGLDTGEGLSEHTAARPAIVQVLSGTLRFTAEGEDVRMVTGSWVHMGAGASHALEALEPTVMLLTLLPSDRQ